MQVLAAYELVFRSAVIRRKSMLYYQGGHHGLGICGNKRMVMMKAEVVVFQSQSKENHCVLFSVCIINFIAP